MTQPVQRPHALFPDLRRRKFNFQLMLLFDSLASLYLPLAVASQTPTLSRRGKRGKNTHIRHRNLRQINLILPMPITQSILHPLPTINRHLQPLNVPIPPHLKINTDPPINRVLRRKDIQIRDPHLDNLRQELTRLLVMRDAHFDRVSGIQLATDAGREGRV